MTHRLGELADLVGGVVEGDPEREIDGVSTLERAGERDLSFLTNSLYLDAARNSGAGALLVPPEIEGLPHDRLVAANAYLALAQVLEALHPPRARSVGVDPTARIHPDASLAEDVSVGPYCVVGAKSTIESGAKLHSHVVVGENCRVGPDCELHPMVVLYDETLLGARVILHSGVVLGADGFGFARTPDGYHKVPQVGWVVVEDDVEIGANSAVDRGMLFETRIGEGTKIDNLVMLAHNVQVGERCLLIAQVGIAGSARIGNDVILAGQTGVAGHMDVGDGVQVASKSAVFKSVEAGKRLAGIPAIDSMTWRRQQVRLRRLQNMEERLARLERKLDEDRSD